MGVCFGNPTTARSAQLCFVLQHYSAVYPLQSICLGQALKGRLDPKWENCVSLYESQNIVRVLTNYVDVDDGDDDDECKNRVDRIQAGTKSALQYIDASNSNIIKLLSILHHTEKKT